MDTLNIFLIFFYFCTCLYITCKLNNYKFQINKNSILIILVISIPYNCLVKLSLFNNLKILLTFICLSIIIKKIFHKNLISSLLVSFFTFLVMIISEVLLGIIFTSLLNMPVKIIDSNEIIHFILNILIYITAVFICSVKTILIKLFKFKNKFYITNSSLNNLFMVSVTITILFNYSLAYKYLDNYLNNKVLILLFILSVFYLIITLTFLYTNHISNKNAQKLILNQQEYTNLKLYSEVTESLIEDISKFKHDYNNIMFMLNGYIENNDYNGLKEYFSKEILHEDKYYTFPKLKKIKNPGLKGLLAAKISKMLNSSIHVSIEILNDVDSFHIDMLDLCRIIGILLDNAYDAAKTSSEKFISISIVNDDDLNIIILNSFNSNINLNQIYIKGYSSKGNNRGIGLHNVKETLNEKYPNALLNTRIEKNIFIQDLYIS